MSITKEQIEYIEKRLQQRYDSFSNMTEEKTFFSGLIDYLGYIKSNPLLLKLAELNYKSEKEEVEKSLLELKTKARNEINEAQQFMFNYLGKNKINPRGELLALMKECDAIMDGKVSSNQPEETLLYDSLWDIIRLLHNAGHKNISERYLEVDKKGNIIKEKISPSYYKYLSEQKHLDELKDISYWGAWEKLKLVYVSSLGKMRLLKELKEKGNFVEQLNFSACTEELSCILKNKNDNKRHLFKLNDYKGYLNRVHNFLIDALNSSKQEVPSEKQEDNKQKFPFKLPAGTKWEQIIFKFLDEENVLIQVRQHTHKTNYKEMGMAKGTKNINPTVLWTFLIVLAKLHGEINIKDAEAKGVYKKQKQSLSEALKSYFRIDLDPFYPYESYPPYKFEKSYKIRMTLCPPPEKNNNSKKNNENNKNDEKDDDELGIKESFDEQTQI